MLATKSKHKIIVKHQYHEKDTGSGQVQIAILTEQIKELARHLRENPKDNHSRRGLLKMVSKRKTLMDHLKKNRPEDYKNLIKKLGLKKNRELADKKQNEPDKA